MFKSKIINIGELVSEFQKENLLVLFGQDAPQELVDISLIHEIVEDEKDSLQVGKKIQINEDKYNIVKVGDEANSNFNELGHVSIYFSDDETTDILPGAVLVTPAKFPEYSLNGDILIH